MDDCLYVIITRGDERNSIPHVLSVYRDDENDEKTKFKHVNTISGGKVLELVSMIDPETMEHIEAYATLRYSVGYVDLGSGPALIVHRIGYGGETLVKECWGKYEAHHLYRILTGGPDNIRDMWPKTLFNSVYGANPPYLIAARHSGNSLQQLKDLLEKSELIYKMSERNRSTVLKIERVLFNAPATIVFWKDGTKTVVKAQGDDEFDPEKGLAMAICKKALGNDRDYYEVFLKHVGRYEKKQRKALEQYGLLSAEELASELQKAAEVATKVMGGLFGNRKDS